MGKTRKPNSVPETASVRKLVNFGARWLAGPMTAIILAHAAYAAGTEVDLHIPPQKLASALMVFSQQTNLNILFSNAEIGNLSSKGIDGHYTPDQALDQLLAGTGLAYRVSPQGAITVGRKHDMTPPSGPDTMTAPKSPSAPATSGEARPQSSNSNPSSSPHDVQMGGLEEITVTATKRGAEVIQNVPMAITAFSGKTLMQIGAQNFSDFARMVPGLTFIDQGPGDKRYVIRGVQSAGEAQVGLYFDDIPVAGTSSSGSAGDRQPDIKLVDVERIEVLRGPQGTLYGSGSTSGTIRYITNKPDATRLSGSMDATLSSTRLGDENFSGSGVLNIPVVKDKFAIRAVGYYYNDSGYVNNVRFGNNDTNKVTTSGGRLAANLKASDQLTISLVGYHQKTHADDSSTYATNISSKNSLNKAFYAREPYDDNLNMANGKIDYDAGWADFTSSTSYFFRSITYNLDQTPYLNTVGIMPPFVLHQPQNIKIWSEEARFNSKFDGPFQIVGGGFYEHRKSHFESQVLGLDGNGNIISPDQDIFYRTADTIYKQGAVFGEATYSITSNLKLLAGLRWFNIKHSDQGYLIIPLFPHTFAGPGLPDSASESSTTKKFEITWHPTEETMLYATASQGFRAGGTNQSGIVEVPASFKPDSLWNYEFGWKSSWLNNRLTINGDVYHIVWTNMQVTASDPTGAFRYIANAGKAKVTGLELEVAASPVQGLTISGGMSVLDPKLAEDNPPVPGQFPGLDGQRIPQVPKFNGNASIEYRAPIHDGYTGVLRADYSYAGSSYTEFDPNNPYFLTKDAYALVNLRAAIETDLWTVAAFVSNLTDSRPDVNLIYNNLLPSPQKITARPRTIGVNLQYKF